MVSGGLQFAAIVLWVGHLDANAGAYSARGIDPQSLRRAVPGGDAHFLRVGLLARIDDKIETAGGQIQRAGKTGNTVTVSCPQVNATGGEAWEVIQDTFVSAFVFALRDSRAYQ
jgi:hypothetical protein